MLFLWIGLVASIAGIMTASRLGSVRYDLALGQELQMVLMAMLGGTYIFGGRGTILGTFLAAWLLGHRLDRHDRRQRASRRAARRARRAADRRPSSPPISSIPVPRDNEDYRRAKRQPTGGNDKC